ncbi:hypothetical protein J6590_097156 [Homalodisca vitripennis]|nr:hypothetical protein J6590_097156 [Homalodisca vitripennis]
MNKTDFMKLKFQYWIARTIQSTARVCVWVRPVGRTNSVNVIVEPLPIGLGLNNCIRVDPWSRLSIPEGRKLFLVGDLRLSHPINKQTVTIWVSVNLNSPLSLRKNLVVLALYQYSRPSPLSEADNIANPRGGVATLHYSVSRNAVLGLPKHSSKISVIGHR